MVKFILQRARVEAARGGARCGGTPPLLNAGVLKPGGQRLLWGAAFPSRRGSRPSSSSS
jgi:hypothetical protein